MLAVAETASVTVTVTVKVPAALGVPNRTPVAAFKVSPLAVSPKTEVELIARLQARDCPTAWVCPWLSLTIAFEHALDRAGIAPDQRPTYIGWTSDREYREILLPQFFGKPLPAMVVWRPEEMVDLALDRLRAHMDHRPMVPTSILPKARLVPARRGGDGMQDDYLFATPTPAATAPAVPPGAPSQ